MIGIWGIRTLGVLFLLGNLGLVYLLYGLPLHWITPSVRDYSHGIEKKKKVIRDLG